MLGPARPVFQSIRTAGPEAPTFSFSAQAPIHQLMEIEVALQYPNGRIHETVYETAQPMVAGSEFAMHGHRWRVIGLTGKRHAHVGSAPRRRLLCVEADS
jgi:hypothetical protein